MLGVSGLMGTSGDGAADAHESGGASGGSSEVGASSSVPGGGVEDSERSGGGGGGGGGGVGGGVAGNRWPRQETLTLLQIRSEMDSVFRDSSAKGPLWEQVSRKMAELGFQRSAKKCKEKFENVYKYHKRTRDGRASKSDGKTYRFFDQLEALENTPPPPPRPQLPPTSPMPTSLPHSTVPSTSPNPVSVVFPTPTAGNTTNTSSFQQLQAPPPQTHSFQPSHPPLSAGLLSDSTSSSTSSDEGIHRRRGRKRKWKVFFRRLMKDVIQKQDELQKTFLDALEKRERDRMAREEAWRAQEIARMNREHEVLVQERSMAAAKDAAVIAFLQKVTEQHNLQIPFSLQVQAENPQQPRQPPSHQATPPPPPPPPAEPIAAPPLGALTPTKISDTSKAKIAGDSSISTGSSRWPKAEVQALIKLRTNLDLKYQESGPKGPFWEEISAAMAKLGYYRSSKRCKEKWENINKYFKKVKESNKKRPEDSKTCPYFHLLDALYKEKAMRPENPMAPIMARPEQQWPLPEQQQHQDFAMTTDQDRDNGSENNDHEEDDDDGGYDDEDEEDEGGAAGYEMVTNKQASSATNATD